MALNPNQDFNSLFNKASYTTMFLDTTAAAIDYTNIASGGNLLTFSAVALIAGPTENASNLLASTSTDANSQYRIIRHLSSPAKKWSDVVLNTSAVASTPAYKSLINNYLYSSGNLLSSESIITALKGANLILKQTDIYEPSGNSIKDTSIIGLYQIKEGGTITPTQQTTLTELENRNLKFFSAFLVEYWFYSCRYRLLLKELFTVYSSDVNSYTKGQLNLSGATKSEYLNKLVELLSLLNTYMRDMISIVNAINTDYSTMITTIQSTINSGASTPGSNKALTNTFTALQTSYTQSDKYLTEKDFSKEVMEYNSEKNRHSNILLGLYAFLNIAALAAVFHLSSS
jgi:hypothetical protein